MSVTAVDFFDTAVRLQQTSTNEADLRSSVSRAYYSAFHAAQAFHTSLATPGLLDPKRNGGVHEELVQRLTHPTLKYDDPQHIKSRQLGILLRQLRASRTTADYDLTAEITQNAANNALALAKRILSQK